MNGRHCGYLLLTIVVLLSDQVPARQVKVRYQEGVSRGFLILKSTNGTPLADGETSQTAIDGTVTNRLTFRFKDGSTYEDTTKFTQKGSFRLISDHVVQRGPAFRTPLETFIDAAGGRVLVHYNKGNKPRVLDQKIALPPDVANGLIFTIVKNIQPSARTTVSYLALTPKPRLVKLVFSAEGKEKLLTHDSAHEAIHYVMRVEIGGILGVVASITNKRPPDTQIWVLDEETPSFGGSEGPLYGEGPVWRIDLVSPTRDGR